jgi:hypothetical protein
MRSFFLVILIAAAWPTADAQSSLPPCPNDSSIVWTNCSGVAAWDHGTAYIGEWKDDKRYGQGSLISPKGHTLAEGIWRDDTVATSGGRWRLVAVTETHALFVLMDSIRQEGAFRRAWTVRAYNEPHQDYRWLSAKTLERFDCADERVQVISATLFSGPFGSGAPLDSLGKTEWSYVPPGSAFESVMKNVCGYKLPNNK